MRIGHACVPGALQHAVLLRRPGTVPNSDPGRSRISGASLRDAVKFVQTEQTALRRFALHRIRDTRSALACEASGTKH
jgi:hypothetical protein